MKISQWLPTASKWFFAKGLDTAAKLLWGAIITAFIAAIAGAVLYLQGVSQIWFYAGVGAIAMLVFVLIVTVALNLVGLLWGAEQPSTKVDANAIDKQPCPDKWLHEIADNDRRFIDNYVKVESCEIVGHDLRNELYVDFKLSILNASVHAVCIDDTIEGDIYFNNRLLRNPVKKIENPARYIGHGDNNHLIMRQWLSSEEIADILSASDKSNKFRFSSLVITINGASTDSEVIPKRLKTYGLDLASKPLRELYREIEIEVQQATFEGHWRFGTIEDRKLFILLHVCITNTRSIQLAIEKIILAANIEGEHCEAYADDDRVIYESRFYTEEGEEQLHGQKFDNLKPASGSPLMIEPKNTCEGWLQFFLTPFDIEKGEELPATLTLVDIKGEKHSTECRLMYKKK